MNCVKLDVNWLREREKKIWSHSCKIRFQALYLLLEKHLGHDLTCFDKQLHVFNDVDISVLCWQRQNKNTSKRKIFLCIHAARYEDGLSSWKMKDLSAVSKIDLALAEKVVSLPFAPPDITEMTPLNFGWRMVGLLASGFFSNLIIFCISKPFK